MMILRLGVSARDYLTFAWEISVDAVVDNGRAQVQINVETLDKSKLRANTAVSSPYKRHYDIQLCQSGMNLFVEHLLGWLTISDLGM